MDHSERLGEAPAEEKQPSKWKQIRTMYPDAFRPFFEITEGEVFERMRLSVIPTNTQFFEMCEKRPDIYGPFWILTTLIFCISFAGNLAMWLASSGSKYDFNFVPFAATLVYGVGLFIPFCLWLVCRKLNPSSRIVDFVCLYGYSLTVFLPVTLLCSLDFELLRWILIVYATGSSAYFIFLNLDKVLISQVGENVKLRYALIGGTLIGHCLMGLYYRVYFFGGIDD